MSPEVMSRWAFYCLLFYRQFQRWKQSRFSWPEPSGNVPVQPAGWPAIMSIVNWFLTGQLTGNFFLQRCRLLLPMIAVSVCQSVCHSAQLGFTVQKRLNKSRCSLRWTLLGTQETLFYTGVLIPLQRGEFGTISPIADPLHVSGMAKATASCACGMCRPFDAAFAKLLWPLVSKQLSRNINLSMTLLSCAGSNSEQEKTRCQADVPPPPPPRPLHTMSNVNTWSACRVVISKSRVNLA